MGEFFGSIGGAPDNFCLGVSVENPGYLWRIEELLKCRAVVRFLSLEPLLGLTDISAYLPHPSRKGLGFDDMPRRRDGITYPFTGIDWVIVGGESGPGARPMHPDWARGIRDQCQMAGAPFFFKQWGAWLHGSQFPLQGPWAELRRIGVKVHGRPIMNWRYKPERAHNWPDGSTSYRVGKKHAGRLLDGREWNETPKRKGG